MADITMCMGRNCPDKNQCWRHIAPENQYGQFWSDFDLQRTGEKCVNFWQAEPKNIQEKKLKAFEKLARVKAERDTLRALLREAIALRVKLFRHSDPFGDTDKESDEKVAMRDPYAAKWNAALKDSP